MRLGVALFLVVATAPVRGQDPAPPLTAPEDFSHIVGRYRIEATAAPTEVRVEDALTLTVRIIGSGPVEYQPRRDKLQILPEDFPQDFYIEPLPEKDTHKGEVWTFAYRLKPKRTDVKHVPALKLVYYNGRKFQTSFTEPIPLKVSPRGTAQAPDQVKEALKPPPQFYELITGDEVLRREEPGWLFRPMFVMPMLLLPPLLCAGWYVWWRRRHPDQASVTRRARSEAAERALHDLSGQTDAVSIAARVTDYLRQRLDLPGAEPTPGEVRDFLWRAGVSRTLRDRFATFLAACDAARFSSPKATPQALGVESVAEDARHLIHALEAEACLA